MRKLAPESEEPRFPIGFRKKWPMGLAMSRQFFAKRTLTVLAFWRRELVGRPG